MTPDPPPSSEGSALPPRHRPNLGNLAKDTTELDLWAFDDEPQGEGEIPPPSSRSPRVIPVPRDRQRAKPEPNALPAKEPEKEPEAREPIKVNVNKPKPKAQPATSAGQVSTGREFEELDNWDDAAEAPPESEPAAEAVVEKPTSEPVPEILPKEEPAAARPASEAAPAAKVLPDFKLSKVERIGLIALASVFVIGGGAVYLATIGRLPIGSQLEKAADVPVKGKHLTVTAADSYWRVPADGDAVRRGTALVPVVELKTEGGPAAIRVFFRNNDGELVGDAVTRAVPASGSVQVAATAGFDDIGMHADYRSGRDKSWTIEIHEAPADRTAGSDFTRLFEMNLSGNRR